MFEIRASLKSFSRYYSVIKKPKGKGVAAAVRKVEREVETNPEILANHCCINYRIGEEPIKLKEDKDYPEWLWKLNLGPLQPISELEPDTKEYWNRIRAVNFSELSRLAKRDGWNMKSHNSRSHHLRSFYGRWCNVIKEYETQNGPLLETPEQMNLNSEKFQSLTKIKIKK